VLFLSGPLVFADEEPSTADQVIAKYMDAIGANHYYVRRTGRNVR
jgi:hypothetical protein